MSAPAMVFPLRLERGLEPLGKRAKEFARGDGPSGRVSGRERVIESGEVSIRLRSRGPSSFDVQRWTLDGYGNFFRLDPIMAALGWDVTRAHAAESIRHRRAVSDLRKRSDFQTHPSPWPFSVENRDGPDVDP
jgi:hypothetical protein